jgi:hypothetical protein
MTNRSVLDKIVLTATSANSSIMIVPVALPMDAIFVLEMRLATTRTPMYSTYFPNAPSPKTISKIHANHQILATFGGMGKPRFLWKDVLLFLVCM